MSIMMGIMAVFMVVGIISGHRHFMGGHDKAEKVEQRREPSGDSRDKGRVCDYCPAGVDIKDGVEVRDEGPGKTETGEETGK